MGYIALKLDKTSAEYNRMKTDYPMLFADVPDHHITMDFGVDEHVFNVRYDGDEKFAVEVYMHLVDNSRRVECFAVTVEGELYRKDGKSFHVTWSFDRANGAKPVMSNDVIKDYWSFNGDDIVGTEVHYKLVGIPYYSK